MEGHLKLRLQSLRERREVVNTVETWKNKYRVLREYSRPQILQLLKVSYEKKKVLQNMQLTQICRMILQNPSK